MVPGGIPKSATQAVIAREASNGGGVVVFRLADEAGEPMVDQRRGAISGENDRWDAGPHRILDGLLARCIRIGSQWISEDVHFFESPTDVLNLPVKTQTVRGPC